MISPFTASTQSEGATTQRNSVYGIVCAFVSKPQKHVYQQMGEAEQQVDMLEQIDSERKRRKCVLTRPCLSL